MLRMLVCAVISLFVCGNSFAQDEGISDSGANKVVASEKAPKKTHKKAHKKANKAPDLTKEIDRYHVVVPGLIRGAQPNDGAFSLLKKYARVKTILDLRNEQDLIKKEQGIAQGLGMKFISIPMDGTQMQSPQTINQILSVMTDKSKQPVFVHCMAGKDRTGMAIAAYRIKYQNWSLNKAVKEMLSYGYDRGCCSNLEKSLTQWAATK